MEMAKKKPEFEEYPINEELIIALGSDPIEDISDLEAPSVEDVPVEIPIIITSFEQMYEDLEAKLNEIGKVEHFYYVHKLKDECLELVAQIKKAAHIG